MKELLEELLSRHLGPTGTVRDLRRRPVSPVSSFAADRITVTFADGGTFDVFFKDLNPKNQSVDAQLVRDPSLDRSRRELDMYRHVLSRRTFDTPQFYGFKWDEEQGLYWLFLECIAGKKICKLADREVWMASARWAARFHVHSRAIPQHALAFLPRFARSHYVECAERVRATLPQVDASDRALLEEALVRYEGLPDRLGALPQSVIHGEFFCKNIMVRSKVSDRMIVAIDWETAAIGPSYLDIASLSSGDWSSRTKTAMRRAYFDQYQTEVGKALDWERFRADLLDVTLYHAMHWLSWWPGQSLRSGKWMRELESVLQDARGGTVSRGT